MMTGMTLPSASTLVPCTAPWRDDPQLGNGRPQSYALTAGYLIGCTVFSLGAPALQRGLAELRVVSLMMEVTSAKSGAALLLLAGVDQLTPMKHAGLRRASPRCDFDYRRRTGGLVRSS